MLQFDSLCWWLQSGSWWLLFFYVAWPLSVSVFRLCCIETGREWLMQDIYIPHNSQENILWHWECANESTSAGSTASPCACLTRAVAWWSPVTGSGYEHYSLRSCKNPTDGIQAQSATADEHSHLRTQEWFRIRSSPHCSRDPKAEFAFLEKIGMS